MSVGGFRFCDQYIPFDLEEFASELVSDADGVQHAPPVLEERERSPAGAQRLALLQNQRSDP